MKKQKKKIITHPFPKYLSISVVPGQVKIRKRRSICQGQKLLQSRDVSVKERLILPEAARDDSGRAGIRWAVLAGQYSGQRDQGMHKHGCVGQAVGG